MKTTTRPSPRRPRDLVGVTVNDGRGSIVLKWPSGRPVEAWEIRAGETVSFERETGVVIKVKRP